MLKKIISGGQTGADIGGLQAGNKSRIPTGGWAPKGFRTEHGSNPELGSLYGLAETKSSQYPPRTKRNVKRSDATLWVGLDNSPGAKLTLSTCKKFNKPVMKIPYDYHMFYEDLFKVLKARHVAKELADWLAEHRVRVLNIAGNRESTNYGITGFTERIVTLAINELKHPGYIQQVEEAGESSRDRRWRIRQEQKKAKREKQRAKIQKQKKKRRKLRRRLPKNVETRFK